MPLSRVLEPQPQTSFPARERGSRDRTSRWEGSFPPRMSSGPWGGSASRPHPAEAAPDPPRSSPGPSPGRGPAAPATPPKSPMPSLRDSQRLPTMQDRGWELGLGRRICSPHHPVTGLRSVTTTTAAFFLGLPATRPPRSQPMTDEVDGRRPTEARMGPYATSNCPLGKRGWREE